MLLICCDNRSEWSDALYQSLLAPLPEELAARAGRFRRWQDRQASILGKRLLQLLRRRIGLPEALSEMSWTQQGRPFLPGPGDFNISHTDGLVICGWTEAGRIGVDVERIRPIDPAQFASVLSGQEQAAVQASATPGTTLLRIWARKEAVAKAAGSGITGDELPSCERAGTVTFAGGRWTLRDLPLPGYAAACAVSEPAANPPFQVEHVDLDALA
jgi:4'-phosphopantetheinyl transferase